MSEDVKGGLVIPMRPQISVELNRFQEVVISTATVSDDFNNVEHKDVIIPADCVKEVAKAMLALLKQ